MYAIKTYKNRELQNRQQENITAISTLTKLDQTAILISILLECAGNDRFWASLYFNHSGNVREKYAEGMLLCAGVSKFSSAQCNDYVEYSVCIWQGQR